MAVALVYGRVRLPVAGWRAGALADVVSSSSCAGGPRRGRLHASRRRSPNVYFAPGIIQFQQDLILGPANQLLGGGALLVNVPVSQYGVGSSTSSPAGFTSCRSATAPSACWTGSSPPCSTSPGTPVMRLAGVGRLLAVDGAGRRGASRSFYHLHYTVGTLPEQGPLRFGLPMVVSSARRWAARAGRVAGRRARGARVLAVAAVWALEAFVYTPFTVLAMVGRRPAASRRARAAVARRQLRAGRGAFVAAHVLLALATLARPPGSCPTGASTSPTSTRLCSAARRGRSATASPAGRPGWPSARGALVSARRARADACARARAGRARAAALIALAGLTVYGIALFSYTDNRSSTYLLPYVALPALLIAVLWLGLMLARRRESRAAATRALAGRWPSAAVMLAAAWPSIGATLRRSALAHAYPGGGLRAALRRLWHPPPIDPRAPAARCCWPATCPRRAPWCCCPSRRTSARDPDAQPPLQPALHRRPQGRRLHPVGVDGPDRPPVGAPPRRAAAAHRRHRAHVVASCAGGRIVRDHARSGATRSWTGSCTSSTGALC